MPQKNKPDLKEMLEKAEQSKSATVNTFNAKAKVHFEGDASPGFVALQSAADGILSRAFSKAGREKPGDDISFQSGVAELGTGKLISGINVSADRTGEPGHFTGWMQKIEDGKVVSQGPISAEVEVTRKLGPGFPSMVP